MAVVFVGDVAWKEAADIDWTVDNWGLDNARLVYRGSRLLRAAFENLLNASGFETLAGFPKMQCTGWGPAGGTVSFPAIEQTFIGFRSGNIPPVKIVNGTSAQTAQGQGNTTDPDTGDAITVSGTFTYRASRTSYTWFATEAPPDTSPYATVLNAQNPLANIISYSITNNATGRRINTIPYSAFVTVFNSLVPVTVVNNYEREELVPNALWGCRADVDYMLL